MFKLVKKAMAKIKSLSFRRIIYDLMSVAGLVIQIAVIGQIAMTAKAAR